MKENLKTALLLLALLFLYGIAGRMDYSDQKAQEASHICVAGVQQ